MDISKFNGFEHIGIPVKDVNASIEFYGKLGFKLDARYESNKPEVAFLSLNNLYIEIYQKDDTARKSGAIDHLAINVRDVDSLYKEALEEGYEIVSDGLESLPFWENGVRFFKILGPDMETIEFLERL